MKTMSKERRMELEEKRMTPYELYMTLWMHQMERAKKTRPDLFQETDLERELREEGY